MLHKMFSIKDAAAEIYHPPFFKGTHGEAERDFKILVDDKQSTLHKFPQQYDLYYLGTYDTNTGKMETLDTPQHVVKASDIRDSGHPSLQPV